MAESAHDDPTTMDTRSRILAAASALVADGGVAALTTRAVAAAASVQPPTLYRLFGDKRGLLDAVAEQGLAAYVAGKTVGGPDADPVEEMREAFDAHIAFGLSHPAVFAIMNEVGRDGPPSPANLAGLAVLRERVRRIARTGRLRLPEDTAVSLVEAVGNGTIATLLAMPPGNHEASLASLARDTVMDAIVGDVRARGGGVRGMAIGLRSHLAETGALSPGERLLMSELLNKVTAHSTDED